jgi:hypothetical protein
MPSRRSAWASSITPPSEALTFFPRNRWQVEGQQDIFIHRSSLLLEGYAASARGIMPYPRLSDYVRLIAHAYEVTK